MGEAFGMPQDHDSAGTIFIVEDDPVVRRTLETLFQREGFAVTCFAEGASFLKEARARTPSCVILDVHIPGKSGMDILKELNAQHYAVPIFVISGQGDIPMAVEAIKNGALDFIEKPFRGPAVVDQIKGAIEAWRNRQTVGAASAGPARQFPGREPLTPREQDVLAEIVAGASNKEAGRKLGISPRTIEVHRARIMEKLGAKNVAGLIRIVMSAQG